MSKDGATTRTYRQYRKKAGAEVTAVKLALDTEGFRYRKWGSEQTCRPGDWLVDNGGDVYTVAADVFEATYEPRGLGRYAKVAPVWAVPAGQAGSVETLEGVTHHTSTAYIVSNHPDGREPWAVEAEKFHQTYEPVT